MIDKTNLNLLGLVSSDVKLRRVAGTNGGEYHGPCPFCGGKDRFLVQPNAAGGGRWRCRQCSGRWQNAIGYVMHREHLDFIGACRWLNIELDRRPSQPRTPDRRPTVAPVADDYVALNDDRWQRAAEQFVGESVDHLFRSRAGRKALDYLHRRGLSSAVITAQNLGYSPADRHTCWGSTDVFLPRGIVIPWEVDRCYWRIRFRLPSGSDQKYTQVKGSANGLYRGDVIGPESIVVLTEGEFDALAVLTHAAYLRVTHHVTAAATGSIHNARCMEWIARLAIAEQVLIAFDVETDLQTLRTVETAASWWLERLPNARRLLPTAHDVTDMWKEGRDIARWIGDAIGAGEVPQLVEHEMPRTSDAMLAAGWERVR